VIRVARWSEQYGCRGILVYADNSLVDPWLVAQIILQNTERLCPLVAVQPVYMHPYSVAKMVASLGFMFGRQLYLNMVAGGFKNDLIALHDNTPHDLRYSRMVEYTNIIKKLLESASPLTFAGNFYSTEQLKLAPPLPPELMPEIFISGSSEAGLQAALALKATAIKYPQPLNQNNAGLGFEGKAGIRVGIIARPSEGEAWEAAERRFPEDRKGQLTHQLAMKVSDSIWHKQLADTARTTEQGRSVYWLRPFENYKTFCPYLVGSHSQVAEQLSRYVAAGYRTVILDIPPTEEEIEQTALVFRQVAA
jgi:alkanesulfonate monooxygenase